MKLCECGCGQTFVPTRTWHRFKDASHRRRGWQQQHLVSRSEAQAVLEEELEAACARARHRLRPADEDDERQNTTNKGR